MPQGKNLASAYSFIWQKKKNTSYAHIVHLEKYFFKENLKKAVLMASSWRNENTKKA